MTGPLDVSVLADSIRQLADRQQVLRTTFPVVDGQRVQRVSPNCDIAVRTEDLRDFPEAQRMERAMHLATDEALRPFDFDNEPLLRVMVVRMSWEATS